jgi:hypothetical protein
VKRLLVVWCPELLVEEETGRQGRALARVKEAVEAFSPAVEVVRPGVCAVATRGPSRYFGGERALSSLVTQAVAEVTAEAGIGIADGLFAAVLAARAAVGNEPVLVAAGASAPFLAPWPVGVLDRPELAELLVRLGIPTLGRFAAVPGGHVLARFGTEGAVAHRVAKGVDGELPGLRAVPAPMPPATGSVRQPGFFGGAAGAAARAAAAARRVQDLLGPEEVLVGRLRGGRSPGARGRLVPFGVTDTDGAVEHGADQPWPGSVPAPAPVVVFARTQPALVADGGGRHVGVSGAGLLTAIPAKVAMAGGPWQEIVEWAGPWPADEHWWSARRRQARMQVVTAGGAHLLVRERGGWWLEATYD